MRKIILAGNWKMHKTQAEAQAFIQDFKPLIDETPEAREVVLCVPYTDLSLMTKTLHGSNNF